MCYDDVSLETAISVSNVYKRYKTYEKPLDRLLELVSTSFNYSNKSKRKFYTDFYALSEVSIDIKKGDAVGIIGRNGSGKSTLLQIICGTLLASSGEVKVNGKIAALLELGSGLDPEFSGLENIFLYGAILGMSRDEIESKTEDILKFADIGEFIHQPVKTYSSGMLVRLAFSVAVCVEPDILIIDEALAVGDAAFQMKCLERIKFLTGQGVTLLFVSHDIGMLQSFCTTAIYLNQGKIKRVGDPSSISEEYFFDIRSEQNKEVTGELLKKKENLGNSTLSAFGSDDGDITKAIFEKTTSSECVVAINDNISFEVAFETKKLFPDLRLSVFLHDYKMLDISGRGFSVQVNEKDGKFQGNYLIQFIAKLRPGQYYVTCRLEHSVSGSNFKIIDKKPAALSFRVSGTGQDFLGTVDMGFDARKK